MAAPCLIVLSAFQWAVNLVPVEQLWQMHNGFAFATPKGPRRIRNRLRGVSAEERDGLRSKLCVGIQWDSEVTDAPEPGRPIVSQVFC